MNNTPENRYDYLIIGQGLAGSLLSYLLMQKGKRVLVLNSYDPKSSSYIACGIYSPIAGQRIAKIWLADEITPLLPDFYQSLERLLKVRFFHPMPYIKLLIDDELNMYAARRLTDPAYKLLLQKQEYRLSDTIVPALEIKHTGRVDTRILLDAYRMYLQHHDAYREEFFDDRLCTVDANGIMYKDIQAERMIFCNGLAVNQNRFFSDIVFYPTKGEILTVRMQAPADKIICGNVFVLPVGDNLFHVGATFARTFDNLLPTQEGNDWLCTELEKIIDVPYDIIDHRVGIRPTTPGHRPFYYWHKEYPRIAVLSGFGAKGISYIPYCAMALLQNEM